MEEEEEDEEEEKVQVILVHMHITTTTSTASSKNSAVLPVFICLRSEIHVTQETHAMVSRTP